MTTFTSAVLGDVHHPINILVEYKKAFGRTKAAILSWIDGWLKTRTLKGLDEWVRLTLDDVAEDLGYCKKTIHKHLKELAQQGILIRQGAGWFPTDTSYAYKINTSVLYEYLCLEKNYTASSVETNHQQCNDEPLTVEKRPTYIDSSSDPKLSLPPQQDSAAVAEEELEMQVDWDTLKNQVEEEQVTPTSHKEEFNQPTVTLCVDEPLQIDSSNETITHEGLSDADDEKPSREEIRAICNELRQIPCTPAFRLSPEMMTVINKHWQNVPGAIAYLKEALRTWKRVDSPEAVFVGALKNGKKPEKLVVVTGFNEWYDWGYRQRLVQAAMTIDGAHCVILANGEPMPTTKAMQLYPAQESTSCLNF